MKKTNLVLTLFMVLSLLVGCTQAEMSNSASSENVASTTTQEAHSTASTQNSIQDTTVTKTSSTTQTATQPTSETRITTTIKTNRTTLAKQTTSSTTKSTTSITSKTSESKSTENITTTKPTTTTSQTTTPTSKSNTTKASTTTKKTKPDHGTPNITGLYHDDMAQEVLSQINAARREAGLNELKMDNGHMMLAAKIRALEITVLWAHERPDHTSWNTVFDEEDVRYNARGENLAKGQRTAQQAFSEWMASPTHKANILQPIFTHTSIVCFEYKGELYWVQLFGANISASKK